MFNNNYVVNNYNLMRCKKQRQLSFVSLSIEKGAVRFGVLDKH